MKTALYKRVISFAMALVMVLLMAPATEINVGAYVTDESVDTMHDLLWTYNLLTDEYERNEEFVCAPKIKIYDAEYSDELLKYCTFKQINSTTSETYQGKSMVDYALSAGIDLGITTNASATFLKLFEINTSQDFQLSQDDSYKVATETYFFRFEAQVKFAKYQISKAGLEYAKKHLNQEFLNALSGLDSTCEDPATFFRTYGTHFVAGYTMGGTAGVYATTASTKQETSNELELAYKNAIGGSSEDGTEGSVAKGKIGTALDLAVSLNKKYNTSDYTTDMDTYSSGGKPLIGDYTVGMDIGAKYTEWARTINRENLADCNIVVDSNLVMYPVWELLPDGDRKTELYNAYMKLSLEQDIAFFDKYVYSMPENTVPDFSDFTIVSNAEELKAIAQDPSHNYVLACNIDLGGEEWTPIADFTGILDGNGNTIYGLRITACENGAAGLFAYNHGEIRNLNVVGEMDVDAAKGDQDVAYIGGIAGVNNGTISNCRNGVSVSGKLTAQIPQESAGADLTGTAFDSYQTDIENAKNHTVADASDNTTYTVGFNGNDYLKLSGTASGVTINVTTGVAPVFIVLENADITGTIQCNYTSARNVFLISIGEENSFTGSIGTVAINLPNENVYICGDADLTLTGGAGIDAAGYNGDGTGKKGGDGAEALNVNSVAFNVNGAISVTGGAGGNGSAGRNGNNGANYGGGAVNSGMAGGTGGAGKNGGEGGNGACPVCDAATISVYAGRVAFYSANGGAGGAGGRGGNGGNGAYLQYENGAPGGHGGAGGHGGNGGIYSENVTTSQIVAHGDAQVLIINMGQLGNGGNGGNGGTGGAGGVGGCTQYKNSPRKGGTGGAGGAGGTGGAGYIGGTGGNGGVGGTGGDGGGEKHQTSHGGDGGAGGPAGRGGKTENWGKETSCTGGAPGNVGVGGAGGKGKQGIDNIWITEPPEAQNGSPGGLGAVSSSGSVTVKYDEEEIVLISASKQYVVNNELTLWAVAKNLAVGNNAKLVSINSAAEQALVHELLEIGGAGSYWIGLKRRADSGIGSDIFDWEDGTHIRVTGFGGSAVINRLDKDGNTVGEGYANFADGEPNNGYGSDGSQLNPLPEAYIHLSANAKWNDNSNDKTFGYITEKTINNTSTNTTDQNMLGVGGVCGVNNGTVSSCVNVGTINAEGASNSYGVSTYAGGIAGRNTGLIEKSYNAATSVSAKAVAHAADFYADAYAKNISEGGVIVDCATLFTKTDTETVYFCELNATTDDSILHTEHQDVSDCTTDQESMIGIEEQTTGKWAKNLSISIDDVLQLHYLTGDVFNKNYIVTTDSAGETIVCSCYSTFVDEGITVIAVKYNGTTRYIPVYVDAMKPETLTVTAEKTEYVVGDSFDASATHIEIVHNNGVIYKLNANDEGVEITEPNMSLIGKQEVAVTYAFDAQEEPISATFEIDIVALAISGIQIARLPSKLTYWQNEDLTLDGAIVEAVMNNGAVEEISLSDLQISYVDMSTVGPKTISISYSGFTAQYQITVEEKMCTHAGTLVGVATAPTCTEQGYTTYICSECGYSYVADYVDALGHDYEAVVTAPTYTEGGYTTYTCRGCGESYVSDYTDPLPSETAAHIAIGNVSGKAGDMVEVVLTLENAPMLRSMGIKDIVYDTKALTLVSGEWLLEGALLTNWSDAEHTAAIVYAQNADLNGDIFKLTFCINDGAEAGEYAIGCTVSAKEKPAGAVETPVSVAVIAGCVRVRDYIVGDMNDDGYIDADDAIYLLYCTLFGEEDYPLNQDCDFSKDGYLDADDAIYLLYHTLFGAEDYPLN